MREDVEPCAQRHLCHLPVPPFPPVASGGCLPSAPLVFLLLCSFHVNLLIYPAPKTVSELPGGAVWGVAAWPPGSIGLLLPARSPQPLCPQLLFLLALRVLGWAGGRGPGQL